MWICQVSAAAHVSWVGAAHRVEQAGLARLAVEALPGRAGDTACETPRGRFPSTELPLGGCVDNLGGPPTTT